MTSEQELRALVRRVVGRVLGERGRTELPTSQACVPGVERLRGVHVVFEPQGEPLRPAAHVGGAAGPLGPGLVTVEDLRSVPDGGRHAYPRGARITELARDEAWRRRIALVEGVVLPGEARREDGRLRIAVGADHGGYEAKRFLLEALREAGHVSIDLGTHDESAVDYPDFARAVAEAVAGGRAELGICIDGAGIGSAMAANKVPGVRAANCWDAASARNAREHNYANVLTLGGRRLSRQALLEVMQTFIATPWGEARHGRRVAKIGAIERQYSKQQFGSQPAPRETTP